MKIFRKISERLLPPPPQGFVNVYLGGGKTSSHKTIDEAHEHANLVEMFEEIPRIACLAWRPGQGLGR